MSSALAACVLRAPIPTLILTLILTLTLCICPRAWGQDAANAATSYQRAIDMITSPAGRADYVMLASHDFDRYPATAELRAALARMQPALRLLEQGAARGPADFGTDLSSGYATLLPHLGPMRQLARIARVDAVVRFADGDVGGGTDRLATMYTMGQGFETDNTLISSLVGMAIWQHGDEAVQLAMDRGEIDPASAAALGRALESASLDNPFGVGDAVALERELASATLEQVRSSDTRLELDEILGWGDSDEPRVVAVREMDEVSFGAAIDDLDNVMRRAEEVFRDPNADDAPEKLAAISADIESGAAGPLALLLAPALDRVLERARLFSAKLEERRAQFAALASGERTPLEMADASIFYRRGVELLEALPDEDRAFLRQPLTRPADHPDLDGFLQRAAPALDQFLEGTRRDRCRLVVAWPEARPEHMFPAFAPGIRDGLRLLTRAGDRFPGAAVTMIGHLAGDEGIAAALIGQRGLRDLAVMTSWPAKDAPVHLASAFQEAAAALSKRDPCGLVAATAELREINAARLSPLRAHREEADADLTLADLAADDLVALGIILDTIETASAVDAEEALLRRRADAGLMSDVLDPGVIDAIRSSSAMIAPVLAEGALDDVELNGAAIGMRDRVRQAVRDLDTITAP